MWLLLGLVVCVLSWKRRALLLALISFPLLAISLISELGVYSLAPAALWLSCAFWLLARGRRGPMVATAVASVVLVYLASTSVVIMVVLYSAPI